MYRHRPSYPALIFAAAVLVLGALIAYGLAKQVEAGERSMSSVLLVGCLSFGIAGILVVAAFARYQFTHLWK